MYEYFYDVFHNISGLTNEVMKKIVIIFVILFYG